MNIRVTNLSTNIIEQDLVRMFSVYGTVGFVVIVRNKKDGRSRGNAFIEMPIYAQGEQAVVALNNKELDGKIITVEEIEYQAGEFNN
jgi:RNA recognition motif-containing protein